MTLKPNEAAELWTDLRQRFEKSRTRIAEVRKWLTHQRRPSIPDTFTGPHDMEMVLPHSMTTPLHTVEVLGRKRPYLRREPIGDGVAARRKSTQIELVANAGLEQLEEQGGPVWLPLVDALFNHGEGALLCYPMPAHWERFPDFADSQGAILKRYRRDKDGRDEEDDHYRDGPRRTFRANAKQSKRAYEEYARDFRARNIPVVARLVTAEECLPVFGPGFRLDGLLVLSYYTVDALRRKGYRWVGGDGHPDQGMPSGEGYTSAVGDRLALLEYWTPGRVEYHVATPTFGGDGLPSIDKGKAYETWKTGDSEKDGMEASVDLAGEFGIHRLCASYWYGAHYAAEKDPDVRGVPFLWPFVPSLGAINNVLTAKSAHAWQHGFGGWFIQYEPGAPAEMAMEDGKPREFVLPPMTNVYIAGKPVSTVHPGTGNDIDELVGFALGAVREEGPAPQQFGGPGATSGHDRALMRDHLEEAQHHVLDGARKGWQWLGGMFLESATAIARTQDTPVAVYAAVKGKQAGTGHSRKAIELTADLCDEVFDLSAYYRRAKGENLPWAQVLYEYWQGGGVPHRMFLEDGLGDEEPEDTMVEIIAEELQFKTEQGRMMLYEEAARELGDERMRELFSLQQEGRAMQDGTPSAAVQGSAPGATGTQMGNPARSAVGGIVQGEMGQQNLVRDARASERTTLE